MTLPEKPRADALLREHQRITRDPANAAIVADARDPEAGEFWAWRKLQRKQGFDDDEIKALTRTVCLRKERGLPVAPAIAAFWADIKSRKIKRKHGRGRSAVLPHVRYLERFRLIEQRIAEGATAHSAFAEAAAMRPVMSEETIAKNWYGTRYPGLRPLKAALRAQRRGDDAAYDEAMFELMSSLLRDELDYIAHRKGIGV